MRSCTPCGVSAEISATSNTEVDFRLNGSAVVMAPGECWYLRLSDPHSVANRGTTDRVHLVVDAVVNDALRRMISPENLEFSTAQRAFTQG